MLARSTDFKDAKSEIFDLKIPPDVLQPVDTLYGDENRFKQAIYWSSKDLPNMEHPHLGYHLRHTESSGWHPIDVYFRPRPIWPGPYSNTAQSDGAGFSLLDMAAVHTGARSLVFFIGITSLVFFIQHSCAMLRSKGMDIQYPFNTLLDRVKSTIVKVSLVTVVGRAIL